MPDEQAEKGERVGVGERVLENDEDEERVTPLSLGAGSAREEGRVRGGCGAVEESVLPMRGGGWVSSVGSLSRTPVCEHGKSKHFRSIKKYQNSTRPLSSSNSLSPSLHKENEAAGGG
jgi:hypothetical protein